MTKLRIREEFTGNLLPNFFHMPHIPAYIIDGHLKPVIQLIAYSPGIQTASALFDNPVFNNPQSTIKSSFS